MIGSSNTEGRVATLSRSRLLARERRQSPNLLASVCWISPSSYRAVSTLTLTSSFSFSSSEGERRGSDEIGTVAMENKDQEAADMHQPSYLNTFVSLENTEPGDSWFTKKNSPSMENQGAQCSPRLSDELAAVSMKVQDRGGIANEGHIHT